MQSDTLCSTSGYKHNIASSIALIALSFCEQSIMALSTYFGKTSVRGNIIAAMMFISQTIPMSSCYWCSQESLVIIMVLLYKFLL